MKPGVPGLTIMLGSKLRVKEGRKEDLIRKATSPLVHSSSLQLALASHTLDNENEGG